MNDRKKDYPETPCFPNQGQGSDLTKAASIKIEESQQHITKMVSGEEPNNIYSLTHALSNQIIRIKDLANMHGIPITLAVEILEKGGDNTVEDINSILDLARQGILVDRA